MQTPEFYALASTAINNCINELKPLYLQTNKDADRIDFVKKIQRELHFSLGISSYKSPLTSTESVKNTQTTESVKNTQTTESVKNTQTTESVENTQTTESVENTQTTESVEHVKKVCENELKKLLESESECSAAYKTAKIATKYTNEKYTTVAEVDIIHINLANAREIKLENILKMIREQIVKIRKQLLLIE